MTAVKKITERKRAMTLLRITLILMGIIKKEIKIVFIIIRYQDFLVEFKVGDFCTRDDSGIVAVLHNIT